MKIEFQLLFLFLIAALIHGPPKAGRRQHIRVHPCLSVVKKIRSVRIREIRVFRNSLR